MAEIDPIFLPEGIVHALEELRDRVSELVVLARQGASAPALRAAVTQWEDASAAVSAATRAARDGDGATPVEPGADRARREALLRRCAHDAANFSRSLRGEAQLPWPGQPGPLDRHRAIRGRVAAEALRRLARQIRAARSRPPAPAAQASLSADWVEAAAALERILDVVAPGSTAGIRATRQALICQAPASELALALGELARGMEDVDPLDLHERRLRGLEAWAAEWDEWSLDLDPGLPEGGGP